ncbi:NAD-dependent epimerase/dehydratase family protein [Stieleria sp. ICT_E10.1]|uniref:polysaccharide biosynthesis C-terminal domain-containing protein n=1 Tax=Stieleria sedimenti TaxID=2976331 RepID=UPI00217F5E96|nr:NAD-dependent epimerase/dehydratase family protein [Stieleria sedimenti]MCS7469423.1 NAD-dependent epimerase/dehydratase family protein [Stieleria sedimenti]
MNLLITGSDGLVGWHTRCLVHRLDGVQFIPCNRQQFADDVYLDAALTKADAVIHLAGANRGEPNEVAQTNRDLAKRLVDRLAATSETLHVLFSNSIHSDRDTPYGQSKRDAAETLRQWADQSGACFTNLVLPHIFGEHGRPFYNSVVSTFAHQLVAGESPQIREDGELELIHAGQVAELFLTHVRSQTNDDIRPVGIRMKVSELLSRISSLWKSYTGGVFPNTTCPTDTQLFNTLRSMMTPEQRAIDLTLHSDQRGGLFEALRCDGGGQVFYSTTKPGITRGNHFHTRKVERFLVVSGDAEIRLRRVLTDEVLMYRVSGERPQAIDMPTLHTHNITNVGQTELKTLFWCNEHFNADDADTFFETV